MGAYLGILFCCHLIGDYYLQGDTLAEHKKTKTTGVLVHSLLYVVAFSPFLILFEGSLETKGLFFLTLFVLHFVVDLVSRKTTSFSAFLIDQEVHLAVLYGLARVFPYSTDLSPSVIGIASSLLLIFKPSSVIVSKLLYACTTPLEGGSSTVIHAGQKIGYLERLIILLLCLFGAISTSALVIAAKTLVRYTEFSDDTNFREVFLVGTLMSISLALIGYGVAKLVMG